MEKYSSLEVGRSSVHLSKCNDVEGKWRGDLAFLWAPTLALQREQKFLLYSILSVQWKEVFRCLSVQNPITLLYILCVVLGWREVSFNHLLHASTLFNPTRYAVWGFAEQGFRVLIAQQLLESLWSNIIPVSLFISLVYIWTFYQATLFTSKSIYEVIVHLSHVVVQPHLRKISHKASHNYSRNTTNISCCFSNHIPMAITYLLQIIMFLLWIVVQRTHVLGGGERTL